MMSSVGAASEVPSSVPSGSLLDSTVLYSSTRLTSYGEKNPSRVFMPALKCLQLEKKKVLSGSRRPKPTPWIISNQYQERHMFESLIRQREEARNAKPVKMGKKKRTKKKA